jgi:HAD superfamily hydrolase (TIGR01509 family)
MIINERLLIPRITKAILWDMDGVLLDTLGLDLSICNELINKYIEKHIILPKNFIRSIFAFHPPEFWSLIIKFIESEYNLHIKDDIYNQILNEYKKYRNDCIFDIHPGIIDILNECKNLKIKLAVVSNNPTQDVNRIITKAGIVNYFDIIVGNDLHKLKTKPAPDTYIYAASLLNIPTDYCVVIEDSMIGAEAGWHAKCFTIGVATGGDSFKLLEQSNWTQCVYTSFITNRISMKFGIVSNKSIVTPNDFISHMIEHIAWRIGLNIDLFWNNNNWIELGKAIGDYIVNNFNNLDISGTALGMIDDGSAEVSIELTEKSDLCIESTKLIDLDWFLSLRCEQIKSGKHLISLIEGIAKGLKARIYICIYSAEDPHHTWEGIFRSIGIALSKIFTPKSFINNSKSGINDEDSSNKKGMVVYNLSENSVTVSRRTAESNLTVSIDFQKNLPGKYNFKVAPSIKIDGFHHILDKLSMKAGFFLTIDYDAIVLNSSHVVMEDTALVLGRALKEIFVLRMNNYGIQGAGSSIKEISDIKNQPISIGISVEGRKFWKFVPFNESYEKFRKRFLIGQNILECLYSEDLDDFIDGLSGGLDCSIVIHIKKEVSPSEGWVMIFENIGITLKEVFQTNSFRKGVPPGVKATLY